MADNRSAGAEDGGGRKKMAGKKLVLLIALPLLLLAGAGAAAAFLLGGGDAGDQAAMDGETVHSSDALKGLDQITFMDLPDILVNLNTGGKQANYLKVKVALELDSAEAVKTLNAVLPRVIDSFNVYLRELRLEDLSGSAGLLRLKEELLVRINASLGGPHVKDVLFKEMLVQ